MSGDPPAGTGGATPRLLRGAALVLVLLVALLARLAHGVVLEPGPGVPEPWTLATRGSGTIFSERR